MNTKEIYKLVLFYLQETIRSEQKEIIDFAILGSSSGRYGWKNVNFCDFDLWLYCYNLQNINIYKLISQCIERISNQLQKINILTLSEAINGPYKPTVWDINNNEILFLHILLDDKNTYKNRSIFTQLSWSKYKPVHNSELLKELLYREPTYYDLLISECGIDKSLEKISKGKIEYERINLSTGELENVTFDRSTTQYREFLLHSIMMIARNRSRLDKHKVADLLENFDFAKWYNERYKDAFLIEVVQLKQFISQNGYNCMLNLSEFEKDCVKWLVNIKKYVLGVVTR